MSTAPPLVDQTILAFRTTWNRAVHGLRRWETLGPDLSTATVPATLVDPDHPTWTAAQLLRRSGREVDRGLLAGLAKWRILHQKTNATFCFKWKGLARAAREAGAPGGVFGHKGRFAMSGHLE